MPHDTIRYTMVHRVEKQAGSGWPFCVPLGTLKGKVLPMMRKALCGLTKLNEGSGTRYNDGVSRFNSNRIVPSMAFLSGGRGGEGRVSAILYFGLLLGGQ